MQENLERIYINGVGVYPFKNMDKVVDFMDENKGILIAVNAPKLVHDRHLFPMINRNVGYCDGTGPILALKQKGIKDIVKIPGCELWLNIIKRHEKDRSFYLVGAKSEVIEETVEKLKKECPNINIVGYRDGYLKDGDKEKLINDIVEKKPDIVFVAMGSPKQEQLMEELNEHHKAIYMGLGGSFNVYTDHIERAPKWWVDHNLEFAYRLFKEPKRIKRQRYIFTLCWWLAIGKFKREK